MRFCDGLLILAEVPYPGRNHTPLADDLKNSRARSCSRLVRGAACQCKIGRLLCFSTSGTGGPHADRDGNGHESESINMFLGQSPPPPHVSLVDTIRNAVGDANTRCFPVSAFGAHDIQSDGAEVPRRDGPLLESRGLEDGFIWTAERCDALRVERLEGAANAASWLAFPQMLLGMTEARLETQSSAWRRWFNGVSVASSISTAWELRRSFPKNSPLRARTAGAIRKLGLKLASQALALLIVLLALFVVIETSLDGINYREVCATREDPAATEEILQHGEVWLDPYFVSPSFRHWLSCRSMVDRSQAHSLLVQFRMRRDNGLWKTVTDAGASANASDSGSKVPRYISCGDAPL